MNEDLIQKYIIGRVEPHIYAFETGTVPNYLKIGDTYRPVSVRLNEWKNKGFKDLRPLFNEPAIIDDRYFRDYQVHEFVEHSRGRNRLRRETFPTIPYYSNEFFENATTQDVQDAILDIRKSAFDNDGRYSLFSIAEGRVPAKHHYDRTEGPYELRPNQKEAVNNFKTALKKKRSHLLMYAVMRFGKSFTAMCCAQEMKASLVVVVSAKADVKTEWKKTVESLKNFVGYSFADADDLKRDHDLVSKSIKNKVKLVVCLTLQDLSNDKIKEHHKELFYQTIDILIVDETHFGARAEHYGKVLPKTEGGKKSEHKYDDNSIDQVTDQIRQLNAKVQLHLSGTPYRILMGSEFTADDIIYSCTFADIVEASEKWDSIYLDNKEEWENPYYGFPQMVRFGFSLNESALHKLDALKKSNINVALNELFKPKSTEKDPNQLHLKFEHEAEVLDLLKAIDGCSSDSNILPFLDNERIKNGQLCRHIVVVLPFRASCDAFETLIERHKNVFKNLNNYKILNISGVEDEKKYPKTESVTQMITECESNNICTITLTVNRMLTGTTVPEWDTMIYLKDTSSPQEYDQAIYRLQSQYVKTLKNELGGVSKRNMKPQTLLVDFDLNRMLVLQELRTHIYDVNANEASNTNLTKRLETELKVSPIISMNKSLLQEITPNDILDAIRAYSSNRSVKDEALEIPVDYQLKNVSLLKELIESQEPIGSRGGLTMKAGKGKDESDIETPESDSSQTTDQSQPNNKPGSKSEPDKFDKCFATLCTRILLFSFLTKDTIISLQDIISAAKNGNDNKRIIKNLNLDIDSLKLLHKHLNPNVLHSLDYKIQNINTLSHDVTLDPISRVENAMRKFGRWSTSEIVTPLPLAQSMLEAIPADRIMPETQFLDIASKEGEFACAIVQKFGETYKDKIYSIPTSPIAYEFTRMVYFALDMPIDNIEDQFTSYDLISDKAEVYIKKIKNMNISIAVGNPPYQDEGGSGGTNDAPIYQKFCDIAKKCSSEISTLVIPSKWFTGGREHLLGDFRRDMMNSGQIRELTNYSIAQELFDEVQIKGGVCYYVRDMNYQGNCHYSLHKGNNVEEAEVFLNDFDVIIREPKLAGIVHKVQTVTVAENGDYVSSIISSDTPFGIPTNPSKSKKDQVEVFSDKQGQDDILLYYLQGSKRVTGYIKRESVEKNKDDISKYKVFVPAAYGAGENTPHQILGLPEYGGYDSVCSQTYLYCPFDTEIQARNFISYLKTKFFRALVSAVKITQHAQSSVYIFVPIQDFNEPWTDEKLYAKYGITLEEQEFIDSLIKPME